MADYDNLDDLFVELKSIIGNATKHAAEESQKVMLKKIDEVVYKETPHQYNRGRINSYYNGRCYDEGENNYSLPKSIVFQKYTDSDYDFNYAIGSDEKKLGRHFSAYNSTHFTYGGYFRETAGHKVGSGYGLYQDDDYSPFLNQTIIEGTAGKKFGEGFWTKPRDYVTATEDELINNDLYVSYFIETFNENDIEVEKK